MGQGVSLVKNDRGVVMLFALNIPIAPYRWSGLVVRPCRYFSNPTTVTIPFKFV